MAKKGEKNGNRRESLRKVTEIPKKKAKEAAKQKAKEAAKQKAKDAAKQKAKDAAKQKAREAEERELNALVRQAMIKDEEYRVKRRRIENERTMNTFLEIGYVFGPEEEKLLDYYLRNKTMDKPMEFCPIKEVSVYENRPQALTGMSKVWYFFTHSRPNEVQPGPDVPGQWILGEKEDVFYHDEKVGSKQQVEYCEAGQKSEYKVIEYQLDPAPDYMKAGHWFLCKLYKDEHSGT